MEGAWADWNERMVSENLWDSTRTGIVKSGYREGWAIQCAIEFEAKIYSVYLTV